MDTLRKSPWITLLLWLLIAIYIIANLLPETFNLLYPLVAAFLFGLIHGARRYGVKGILIFTALCLGISFTMENIGVATGFPFGNYDYPLGVLPGPRIGLVPLIIGLGYFGTGYVSWVLADLLLDRPDRQPDNPYAKFALPVIASFVMVTWDLVMDPSSSTLGGFWIWHNGGGFFGVPLSNYLGWYLTVWLFYQAFALYLGLKQNPVFTNPSKTFWYQAIVMYLSIGFVATIFPSFTNVTDRAGRVWWTGNMAETAVIFFLFSMVFICAFSLIKVFQINDPPGQS